MTADSTAPRRGLLHGLRLRIEPVQPEPGTSRSVSPGPDPTWLNQEAALALVALLRSFREATVWTQQTLPQTSEGTPGSTPEIALGRAEPVVDGEHPEEPDPRMGTPPHLLPPPLLPASPNVILWLEHPVAPDRWQSGTKTLIPPSSPPLWRDFVQQFHQELVAQLRLPDLGVHVLRRPELADAPCLVFLSQLAFASHLTVGPPLTQRRRVWQEAYHLFNSFVTAARRYPAPWEQSNPPPNEATGREKGQSTDPPGAPGGLPDPAN